jgi:hypothetical protein
MNSVTQREASVVQKDDQPFSFAWKKSLYQNHRSREVKYFLPEEEMTSIPVKKDTQMK